MSMLDCYLKSLSELETPDLAVTMSSLQDFSAALSDQSMQQQSQLQHQQQQNNMENQQLQQQSFLEQYAQQNSISNMSHNQAGHFEPLDVTKTQHDPASVAAISASAYNLPPPLLLPNHNPNSMGLPSAAPSALGSTVVNTGSAIALTPTSISDPSQQPLLSPTSQQPQQERKYMCPWPECGKRFMRRTDVTRHMRIHLNDRPFKCEWPECGKAFMQRSALKIHYRTHTGEKPNICPFEGCGKAFNDTSSLARHRRTHFASHPYPCVSPGCGEKFPNRKALIAHEKAVHRPPQSEDEGKKKSTPKQSHIQPSAHINVVEGTPLSPNGMTLASPTGLLPALATIVSSPNISTSPNKNANDLMAPPPPPSAASVAARRNLSSRPFGLKIPPLHTPMGTNNRNMRVELDPPMSAPILSNPYGRLHPYLTPPSPVNGFTQLAGQIGSPVSAHPMLFDAVTSPMMHNLHSGATAGGFQIPNQPMMLSSAGLTNQFSNASLEVTPSSSPLISQMAATAGNVPGAGLHQLIQHQSERQQRAAMMNAHEAARKRATSFNVMSTLRDSFQGLQSPTIDNSGLVASHMSPSTPNTALQTPTSMNSVMQFNGGVNASTNHNQGTHGFSSDAMMTLTSSLQQQQQQQQYLANRARADSNLSFAGSLVDPQTESVMRQLISGSSPQIQMPQLHDPSSNI